jgi:hypothetical protein
MASGEIHHLWYRRIFFPVVLPFSIVTSVFLINSKINSILFFAFCFIQCWLANFIGPDLDLPGLNDDDGRMMRFGKKINPILTIFGYTTVAYWFFYSWIISLFGGHRSFASHGFGIGTILRIIYFNIPIFIGLFFGYKYGVFGTGGIWFATYMDIWFLPYLLSQFGVWLITDSTHLMLDKKWAKGNLYTPIKK